MRAALILLALLFALPALAEQRLADPKLEARAGMLFKELRCLVCGGQSIEDSPAELAADMRGLVREKLVEGLSDTEIRDYLKARYGDYVLLKPPLKGATLPLYLLPWLLLLGGLAAFIAAMRQKKPGRHP